MQTTAGRRRTRFASLCAAVATVGVVTAIAAALATMYDLSLPDGLMTGGTVVLVYQVPAVIFDWPRLTFGDLSEFGTAAWGLLTSWF